MSTKLPPVDYLRSIDPASADAFQALRKAVMKAGPLDHKTCELISLGALVTARQEDSFKVHARRLLKDGVEVAALRHAVLATFAASTTFSQIIEGLTWIDDLAETGS